VLIAFNTLSDISLSNSFLQEGPHSTLPEDEFFDEGEIKMYKREEEVNGLVMDPLKAYHTVQGVTAREMCHYFFMPEFRNDWESEYSN